MKKLKFIVILFPFISFLSCNKNLEIIFFEVSPEEAEIVVDEELAIKASVSFSGEDSVKIIWDSSNKNVATVSEFGLVKALKVGETSISVSCSNMQKICNIKVVDNQLQEIK